MITGELKSEVDKIWDTMWPRIVETSGLFRTTVK